MCWHAQNRRTAAQRAYGLMSKLSTRSVNPCHHAACTTVTTATGLTAWFVSLQITWTHETGCGVVAVRCWQHVHVAVVARSFVYSDVFPLANLFIRSQGSAALFCCLPCQGTKEALRRPKLGPFKCLTGCHSIAIHSEVNLTWCSM